MDFGKKVSHKLDTMFNEGVNVIELTERVGRNTVIVKLNRVRPNVALMTVKVIGFEWLDLVTSKAEVPVALYSNIDKKMYRANWEESLNSIWKSMIDAGVYVVDDRLSMRSDTGYDFISSMRHYSAKKLAPHKESIYDKVVNIGSNNEDYQENLKSQMSDDLVGKVNSLIKKYLTEIQRTEKYISFKDFLWIDAMKEARRSDTFAKEGNIIDYNSDIAHMDLYSEDITSGAFLNLYDHKDMDVYITSWLYNTKSKDRQERLDKVFNKIKMYDMVIKESNINYEDINRSGSTVCKISSHIKFNKFRKESQSIVADTLNISVESLNAIYDQLRVDQRSKACIYYHADINAGIIKAVITHKDIDISLLGHQDDQNNSYISVII